jgi:uncharacterized membrane protein
LSDSKEEAAGFIPRSRLEALTDGVFAFAMTLLVVNIEVPQDFHPKTNQEFLAKLASLSDTFTAYIITFFVLVGFWSGRAEETGEPELASPAYARATLLHLLAVTFLPFSMLAVSRYDVAGAVWIYGANMILLAVTAITISRATERDSGSSRAADGRIKLCVLIAAALLSMIATCTRPITPCCSICSFSPHRSWPAPCIDCSWSSFIASPRNRARACQRAFMRATGLQ